MAREPAPITAAAGSASNSAQPPAKKVKKQQQPANPDSKNQKKKARKKAKKLAQASWCWYCDREFEDDRILLSHQKAKHFRCSHCPRRLNTAGGLAVHIDQVHKLPVDKLENTLPGRDSFDVEIYGMEGIPKNDLEEWRRKRDAELGIADANVSKRPKVAKGIISIDELAKQLAIHKSLMRQSALRNQQPAMGGPPDLMRMPGAPMPPINGASPFPMPPGVPMPPPGMFPLPPNIPLPPGFGSPMPGAPVPGAPVPGMPAAAAQVPVPQAAPYVVPSSRAVQKSGQVHIYADSDVSPEEKRAKNPKYASTVAAASTSAAPVSAPVQPAQTQAAAPPATPLASVPGPNAASTTPASAPTAAANDDSNPRVSGQKRARAADLI